MPDIQRGWNGYKSVAIVDRVLKEPATVVRIQTMAVHLIPQDDQEGGRLNPEEL